MILGLDFDNTIVCYDELFQSVALERGLVPRDIVPRKEAVRYYLRSIGREDDWTELQGYVYGVRMAAATCYPGFRECLGRWIHEGVRVFIVSHKTRFPYLGERHDLHRAAWDWMEQQGLFDKAGIGMERDHVFLELTKQAKIERIEENRCTHFVDDLPEFLLDPSFPAGVERILFDPHGKEQNEKFPVRRGGSWMEIDALITPRRGE